MKKTMKSLIIVIFLIIIAGIVIIAANQDQVGHIPLSVRNLEQNIEFFDGAEFEITTDQSNYSQGEEITITATVTNYNSTNITIFCDSYNLGASFYVAVYDEHYELVSKEYIGVVDNLTNPQPYGFGTMNFTLSPNSTITCEYKWNQTYNNKNTIVPHYTYGEPVPSGIYRPVVEIKVAWEIYYDDLIKFRNFGKETIITIT